MKLREILSTAIEVIGLVCAVYGVALFSVPAAIILAGLIVVLVGVAVDPPARKGSSQ